MGVVVLASNVVIPDSELPKLGNIDSSKDQYGLTYQSIDRSVDPKGVLYSEHIALKKYHMIRETEPLPQNLVDGLELFLMNEIKEGFVKTDQGMGFAILSQGFLSINLWKRGNVLFTQTYTVEENFPNLSREPLEKTGVACTWESKIMGFEYNLWHHYLQSSMQSKDKRKYLETFLVGELSQINQ